MVILFNLFIIIFRSFNYNTYMIEKDLCVSRNVPIKLFLMFIKLFVYWLLTFTCCLIHTSLITFDLHVIYLLENISLKYIFYKIKTNWIYIPVNKKTGNAFQTWKIDHFRTTVTRRKIIVEKKLKKHFKTLCFFCNIFLAIFENVQFYLFCTQKNKTQNFSEKLQKFDTLPFNEKIFQNFYFRGINYNIFPTIAFFKFVLRFFFFTKLRNFEQKHVFFRKNVITLWKIVVRKKLKKHSVGKSLYFNAL